MYSVSLSANSAVKRVFPGLARSVIGNGSTREVVVPYFNYTLRTAGKSNPSEVGGVLKIPILVKSVKYSFSGD